MSFDTVVVTSQKRAQNIQDVAVAVSAVTDSVLDDAGAKNLADYARLVPGLVVTPSQFNGGGTPLLRGIASSAGEATVGYYLDDSPIQVRTTLFSSSADLKLFDMSRIEVLRGPQGTLYGSGSMGGTIRLITAQPSLSSTSGKLRAEVSSIDGGSMNYEFGAAAGGPLVEDTLGYRASAFYRRDGGWVDQVSRTSSAVLDEDINETESLALKGALLYQPIEQLEIIPSIFYQSAEGDDQAQYQSNLLGYKVQTTSPQPVEDDFMLAALTMNYDLGPATLTSI
ncbi:MAG: TonB-dependent receptor plug domain-containing protein, partial [Hyphomonadaceae bacterium]|nr:TonB-dependent receptor plug domain-containing protein [Hyphomonadaceae bacterium]